MSIIPFQQIFEHKIILERVINNNFIFAVCDKVLLKIYGAEKII